MRSTAGGPWETIFSLNRARFSFSAVTLPNGKTRIYLSDAPGGGQQSQAYRIDDARQPAATMTASNNAAWERLSSPVDGTPGFASWAYCNPPSAGNQCAYDMFILSPPDRPDMVVLGGPMNYNELPPYGNGRTDDRSNGRAVLLSTDAGATWTDQTGDPADESMHPDQHAIAFVPGNPDVMFVGSDGGVIRTNGKDADASGQCDERGLSSALFLADCKAWLKRVPQKLEPINSGLATLQLLSISVSPHDADQALAGTQDNGSINFSGSPTWLLGVTGDGGDSGFDAVDPNVQFHTYYVGWMDVNFRGSDPKTWVWIGDKFFPGAPAGESIRMYPPTIADPVAGGTIFLGASHVWRTQDSGGDRAFLEAHCNTTNQFGTSDKLFTGACGDFVAIGPSLTAAALGTRSGGNLAALGRGTDGGTSTPTTPGHVFDVVFDPASSSATWTDISHDLGDEPVLDSVIDPARGDVYVGTDFAVDRLAAGSDTWTNAADGLPRAVVSGLTLTTAKRDGTRLIYAATHGRGAYRLLLK